MNRMACRHGGRSEHAYHLRFDAGQLCRADGPCFPAGANMNELEMQHGQHWKGEDLSGWLASEKFDGCRVFWDGYRLWSRGGIDITIPHLWRDALPSGQALDCELLPRKAAEQFIRRGKWDDRLELKAFDCPTAAGSYPERMATIPTTWLVQPVKVWKLASTAEALELMRAIQRQGGEGLMVRHPGLVYRPGRTSQLLKVKYEP